MKVIFIPEYRKGNPYQNNLTNSLNKFGITVEYAHGSGLFSLTKLAIKNNKTDIIHFHWIDSLVPLSTNKLKTYIKCVVFLLDLFIVKSLGIKLVWTVHNLFSHECNDQKLELFTRSTYAKNCSKIIIHCPTVEKEIVKLYKVNKDKLVVIPHGHYIDNYKNSIDKNSAKSQLGINPDSLVYLSMGSLRSYKGCSELIETFKNLNNDNAVLIVAGKPANQEIEKDINKRVKDATNIKVKLGFVDDNDVQVYMNAADVVVLPYRKILNSGVAVLAMSFKKAVLAPAIGCLPYVINADGGFLFDPSNKVGLLNAMQKAKDADLEKMGNYNYQSIKRFDWDDIGQKTFDMYKNCLMNL